MDRGIYKDFVRENVIWCFDTTGGFDPKKGPPAFKEFHINHAIAGDSDSIYCKIPSPVVEALVHDLDELVAFSDDTCSFVNESFPTFLREAFNIPEDRLHLMRSERELVADAGLFLAKKRYMLHMVDKEGTRCNKLKIMGVELKRSSTSDFLRAILTKVTDVIIRTGEEEEVTRVMQAFKRDIYSRPIYELATSSTCKTLVKAQKAYEMAGSLKGLHITAKGAMVYNLRAGPEDVRINPGDKVYILYVRGEDFTSIAIPMDVKKIPDWVNTLQVDYEKIWKTVEKSVLNYLKAMEWDMASKKKKTKDRLVPMKAFSVRRKTKTS